MKKTHDKLMSHFKITEREREKNLNMIFIHSLQDFSLHKVFLVPN